MNFLKYYQKLDDAISYLFSSVSNEKKLLKDNLKKREIIYVDIGTNVGNYLEFIKKNFKTRQVFCFEPIESLFKELNLKYITKKDKIYNIALSDKETKKFFYIYEIPSQSSFYIQNDTYKSVQKIKKKLKIKTQVFDNIFNKNLKIDFCKIDAQGEDLKILRGMKRNLKNGNIKLIKVEICFPLMHKDATDSYLDILNFLKKFNYNLFSITKIKYKNNHILFMDAFFKK